MNHEDSWNRYNEYIIMYQLWIFIPVISVHENLFFLKYNSKLKNCDIKLKVQDYLKKKKSHKTKY